MEKDKKRLTRKELIAAERVRTLSKEDDNNVKEEIASFSGKSKFIRTFLVIIQVFIIVVIPISGALNTPLSSLFSSKTYESMLSKIENDDLELDSNLNKVMSSNSRYKVRASANSQCTPGGSANGDKLVNKNFHLQWPMHEGTYEQTSPFGYRSDPATGRNMLHSGADMAAPVGTPIFSIADGKVKTVDTYGGAGRIIISHEVNGQQVESWYLHMYQNGIYVKEGQEVKRGDKIAGVGSSGYSTGPHLHIEIHPDGADAVDPLRWLKENNAVLLYEDC